MATPVPSCSPSVICKEMGEGAVLFCTRTEVYFGLNQVGLFIWRRLAEGTDSLEAMVEAMADAFPGQNREDLEGDLVEFIDAMKEGDLLVASDIRPGAT